MNQQACIITSWRERSAQANRPHLSPPAVLGLNWSSSNERSHTVILGSLTFQRELKIPSASYQRRKQNALSALMCGLTCLEPLALRPLNRADGRGSSLWSLNVEEIIKRWSTSSLLWPTCLGALLLGNRILDWNWLGEFGTRWWEDESG